MLKIIELTPHGTHFINIFALKILNWYTRSIFFKLKNHVCFKKKMHFGFLWFYFFEETKPRLRIVDPKPPKCKFLMNRRYLWLQKNSEPSRKDVKSSLHVKQKLPIVKASVSNQRITQDLAGSTRCVKMTLKTRWRDPMCSIGSKKM